MENTGFQKKIDKEVYGGLTTALNDILCLKGVKVEKTPYSESSGKNIDEVLSVLNEEVQIGDKLYLAPNQRYFMGAGSEPELVIVAKMDDDNIYYYEYPWKEELMIELQTGADLMSIGCETFLRTNTEQQGSDLYKSIQAVVNGRPGVEVKVEDLQHANIQISYTGKKKGDRDPWIQLETEYGLNVNSVLNNKQIYNVRLTRRELKELEDRLEAESPSEKVFTISKIMMESRLMFIESSTNIRALAPGAEMDVYRTLVADAISEKHAAEGVMAGDEVIFKGEEWLVGGFISDGPKLKAMLVKKDFSKVADLVGIDKVKIVNCDENGVPEVSDTEKNAKNLDKTIDASKEMFAKSGQKEVKLKMPQTKEDGTVVHSISDKDLAKSKIDKVEVISLTEAVDSKTLLRNLYENIKTDEVVARNRHGKEEFLIRRKQNGTYDPDEATKSFMYVVEEAAKKVFNESDGRVGEEKFVNWQKMFPVSLRERLAIRLRKNFDAKYESGAFNEDIQTFVIDLSKKKLITEDEEQEVENQNIEFTSRELEEVDSHAGFRVEAANVVAVAWDDGTKKYRTEVTKMKNPKGPGFVYHSKTYKNDKIDPRRSVYSKSFLKEDDPVKLKDFLSQLDLARSKNI